MKRHICKKCGKERWARTYGKGEESFFVRDTCKRCLSQGSSPKAPREKRVKSKRALKGKPSGRKGRKADDRR